MENTNVYVITCLKQRICFRIKTLTTLVASTVRKRTMIVLGLCVDKPESYNYNTRPSAECHKRDHFDSIELFSQNIQLSIQVQHRYDCVHTLLTVVTCWGSTLGPTIIPFSLSLLLYAHEQCYSVFNSDLLFRSWCPWFNRRIELSLHSLILLYKHSYTVEHFLTLCGL